MTQYNRWNHEPDGVPQGDEFLVSSAAFPGVCGERETREEAIDFWEGVEFIGGLARAPDWPHDGTPYVDEWETLENGAPRARDGDADPHDKEPWPWADDEKWKAE